MEDDLTVLIDYEKYQDNVRSQRVQRQVLLKNDTETSIPSLPAYPLPFPYAQSNSRPTQFQRDYQRHDDCDDRGILLNYFLLLSELIRKVNLIDCEIH